MKRRTSEAGSEAETLAVRLREMPDVYLINLSSYFISIDSSVRGEFLKPVVLLSLEQSALRAPSIPWLMNRGFI